MLQKLRDKSSGWIVTVVLGLLMIPFLFVIDSSYLGGVGAQNVAKVQAPPTWWKSAPSWWPVSLLWQHHEISTQDFRTRYEQVRMQQRQRDGDNFDAQKFESIETKREVLDQLIDEQVARLSAQQAGIVIGENTVNEYIRGIPAFQSGGTFNYQQYKLMLAQGNPPRTQTQFKEQVRDELQQSVIAGTLQESSFATKREMERLMNLLGETRDVQMALLPEPAADEAPVTDAQIKQWYDSHQADFRQAEQVTLEYIELTAANVPAAKPADEATLRRRYEDEKARFVTPDERLASHILVTGDDAAAEAKAKKIAADAKAPGADFAALAKANSEDPGSKNDGGDLGWVRPGAMVQPFNDALFAMKAGEISEPVKSQFGWHVIQLREIKGGEGQAFEEVRDQLAAEQLQADTERAFSDLGGRLVDIVNRSPGSLEPAAKELGLPLQTTAAFSAANPPGVASNPAVLRAAFSDMAVQDRIASDLIELGTDHSVIIRVTDHTPEQAIPLDKAREQVIAAVRADRVRQASEKAADALLAKLRAGQTLQELAASEKFELSPVSTLTRTQPVPTPEINRAVFSAPKPEEGKTTYGKVLFGDSRYMVFGLTKVGAPDLSEVPEQESAMLKQQLAQMDGYTATRAYIKETRKHYKVQIEESQL